MKINTVNVFENADGEINLTAFPETPAGNQEAEKVFAQCALEHQCDPAYVDDCIENGSFTRLGYELYLVHSS